jgi:hypothetical protein
MSEGLPHESDNFFDDYKAFESDNDEIEALNHLATLEWSNEENNSWGLKLLVGR